MRIAGIIKKEEGPWWSANADAIGAFTQGRSAVSAASMLKALVETMIDRPRFRAKIVTSATSPTGVVRVFIESNDPAALGARVLKYQRGISGLSLAAVSKILGMSSRNAYARYEQGRTEPTLSKYTELLAAVSPGMALVLVPGDHRPTKATPARKASTR